MDIFDIFGIFGIFDIFDTFNLIELSNIFNIFDLLDHLDHHHFLRESFVRKGDVFIVWRGYMTFFVPRGGVIFFGAKRSCVIFCPDR